MHQSNNLTEAEQLYKQILSLAPSDPDALNLLGVLAFQRKKPDEAESLIRRAIASCPTVAEYYHNLGDVLIHQGKIQEAEASYQQAIQVKDATGKPPLLRFDVVQAVLDHLKGTTYLEIGVDTGRMFGKIKAARKFGVDPEPTHDLINHIVNESKFRNLKYSTDAIGNIHQYELNGTVSSNQTNGVDNPSRCELHYVTSDQFFAEQAPALFSHDRIHVAFVDGLHSYEQAYRDVLNVLDYLDAGGVILMHDCNPAKESTAVPATSYEEVCKMHIPDWDHQWCGDVWKAVVRLRANHDDLKIFVLDCDFGIGVVYKGQPEDKLNLSLSDIERMTYDDLDKNRKALLNLKPPSFLWKFITHLQAPVGR